MDTKKIAVHIVSWLKDYAEKSRVNGFVIGISGGVDSALTSTLCAMTGLKTVMIEMPIHQDESQVSRGKTHIEFLKENFANCSNLELDLTQTYDQFLNELTGKANVDKSEEVKNLTLGNTRARLRMTSLYAIAGIEGLLVAGTGNKVEDFGVGFFTKYGDGGVDISPIADLYKSEVFELSEYLGVNDEILTAAPTDGLWDDGRTDEDQIGATYAELEDAMKTHEMFGENPPKCEFESVRNEIVWKIYLKRFKANQHKMNPIPVCELPWDLKG